MPEPTVRSADILANAIKASPNAAAIVQNPAEVDKLAENAKAVTSNTYAIAREADAIVNDRVIYRMTTCFLGTLAIIAAIGIITIALAPHILIAFGKSGAEVDMPEALVAIASAAIGALAGLLSPIGAGRSSSS